MKFLYSVLQVLGMTAFALCCDCTVGDYSWKRIGPKDSNGLNLNVTVYFTENCNELAMTGTTGNLIGQIHAVQVECDGVAGGFPIVAFSDPNGCKLKDPSSAEAETTFARNFLPIFFGSLHKRNFEVIIPLNDNEKEAVGMLSGDFDVIIRHKNINNIIGFSDYHNMKMTLTCSYEEY